jgi:hypothetical protein
MKNMRHNLQIIEELEEHIVTSNTTRPEWEPEKLIDMFNVDNL